MTLSTATVSQDHAEAAYQTIGNIIALLETYRARHAQAQSATLAALKARIRESGGRALLEEYRGIAWDLGDWVRQGLAKGGLCEPPPWAPTLEDVLQLLGRLELLARLDHEMGTSQATASAKDTP